MEFLADRSRTINESQLSALTGGTLAHVHLVIPMDQMTRNQMYPELAVRAMVQPCTRCGGRCWFDTQSTVAPGFGTVICYECAIADPDGLPDAVHLMPDAALLWLITMSELRDAREANG